MSRMVTCGRLTLPAAPGVRRGLALRGLRPELLEVVIFGSVSV